MDTEADNEFLEKEDENHAWHKIHLLKNLRQLKNSVARKNIQVTRSRILHEISDHLNEVDQSNETNIEEKLAELAQNISSVRLNSSASGKEEKPLPNTSLSSFRKVGEVERNSESGTTFLSTIELLGTLYDISKDDAFFQQQERLVSILNKIKKKDSPDKELEHIEAEYLRLSQAKNKFDQISSIK